MTTWFNFRSVLRLAIVMSVVAALLAACGDDDVTLADFEGSWEAASFTVTATENAEQNADVVGLGANFVAQVDGAGQLEGTVSIPAEMGGPLDLPFAATLVIEDQENLTIEFAQEIPPLLTSYTGPFEFEGDRLTSTDENAVYDFGDGNLVPATAVIVLERSS